VARVSAIRASAAAAAALALGGCGLGAGTAPTRVSLLVTQGFGAQTLLARSAPKIVGADTVMRMLERNARVTTRYAGGFVQSVDGLAGGGSSDWFYYVNGVEAPKGSAATRLHGGDHVWWDYHDWSATETVPAVVGSFPEPFLDGYGGQKLPIRIECTTTASKSCSAVQQALTGYGLLASLGCFLCSTQESLRVLVGPYATLTADPAAAQLQSGVASSGVYARFEDGGRRLALLDARGRLVRVAGAGAGLVAATRYMSQPPVWLVAGTDRAGVAAAVQAFNAQTLDDHFAVAVVDGAAIPLPDGGR
jgi:hypothetical protein